MRSLYQCLNAKVTGNRIACSCGKILNPNSKDGGFSSGKLARGKPLEMMVCQDCKEYDDMGPPIPENERGWVGDKSLVPA